MKANNLLPVVSLAAISFFSTSTLAESSLQPLILPQPEDQAVIEHRSQFQIGPELDLPGFGLDEDLYLSTHDTIGFFAIPVDTDAFQPFINFRAKALVTDADQLFFPLIPEDAHDISASFGATHVIDDQWSIAWGLGLGYAGDGFFEMSEGYYGTAGVSGIYQIDDRSSIAFFLDYDGNRTYFPDVPLPGFAYTLTLEDPNLTLVFGFPFSSVTIKPIEALALEGSIAPGEYELSAIYTFIPELSLETSLRQTTFAFHSDDVVSDYRRSRRVFLSQNTLEAMLHYQPTDWASLRFGAGYAFGQEISFGFDTRHDATVYELKDAPFVALEAQLSF